MPPKPTDRPEGLEVVMRMGDSETTIHPDPHTFKSGTSGWYFRQRVLINGVSHHVQLIISK